MLKPLLLLTFSFEEKDISEIVIFAHIIYFFYAYIMHKNYLTFAQKLFILSSRGESYEVNCYFRKGAS